MQAALDIPLPYYIRLNFTAFEKLIDMIGGIDIEVAEPIDDPDYPDAGFGYDPFYIDAGWQHMDGRTALKYARTRATAGSDLDRVKRQQQVILTVRDKILKNNQLSNVLAQLGPLLQLPGGPVQTNLTPGQIVELINLAAADRSGPDSHRDPDRRHDRSLPRAGRAGSDRVEARRRQAAARAVVRFGHHAECAGDHAIRRCLIHPRPVLTCPSSGIAVTTTAPRATPTTTGPQTHVVQAG